MKSNESLEIEQALHLIEQVLLRCGSDGEHFVPPQDNRYSDRGLVQARLAAHKSLASATRLLGVALMLMNETNHISGNDASLKMKSTIEKLKVAARGAYEAGHLLVGVRTEAK